MQSFERPSAIQSRAIVPVIKGHDVIAQAQSGTGKTATFSIAILQRIDPNLKAVQALVLAPTRELAQQIQNVVVALGDYMNIQCHACIGGTNVREDMARLGDGAQVVVGTPGRVYDMINRGAFRTDKLKMFCLDEADEMLDLGFLPDIERIMAALPEQKQTMLFSATMPGPIVTLARTFSQRPTHIRAEHANDSAVHERTTQYVYRAHAMDKAELVARILQADGRGATMIFTRTKRTAQKVADDLAERGFSVGAVHGDLGQVAREKALKKFRTGEIDVLVATDVAARGIDIDDVTHVINYQCPDDDKTYVHRIGRTGRAGRTGIAITLVDWDELHRWELIDSALKLGVPEPAETYSTSEHLREELGIPESATGRVAAPKRERPEGERVERTPRAERTASSRTRRRTRGGKSGSNAAAASNGDKNSSSEADNASDAGKATASNTDDAASAGTGESKPRRRRRRRGGAGRGSDATAAHAADSAPATATAD